MGEQQITIGIATRPHPKEVVNGDTWSIDWNGSQCRVAVIDGLGHGRGAAEASDAAREQLSAHPELGAIEALTVCHRALSRTRGVCMSVACIDTVAQTVSCAGVGNVETRVWQRGREKRLMNHRGIIGARVPTLDSAEIDLEAPWMLVIHTDGVSTHFHVAEVLQVTDGSAQALADTVLASSERVTDDATVIVISGDA